MPVVALDGEYVAVFKFNEKIETEIFASRRALFDRFSAVRAELERRPYSDESPRLAALVAILTDEVSGREPQDYSLAEKLLNQTLYGEADDKNGGSPSEFDKIFEPEPEPLPPGIPAPWKGLEDDARSAAIRHVSRLRTDEEYRQCVAEAEAAEAFNSAAALADAPIHQATKPVEQFAAAASQPVPSLAPRLWSERDKKTEKNPAEFIRRTYAFCMANLGQNHLWTLDRGLYRRYVDWKDEPKELVNGKIEPCDQPVEFGVTTRLSDEERGRRAREQSNATKAKKRAQQKAGCDIPPHLDP